VKGSTRFYAFFALTVFVLVAFEAFLTSLPFADAIPDNTDALKARQLDSYFQMIQLLITLSTLVMGGITGFVVNRARQQGLSGGQLRRVVASWTLCAASLYLGYLSYQQTVWMLNNGFFNPYNLHVWIPTRGQFWCFLSCVVVFADYVYLTLQAPAERKEAL
jgi:hypothetical protein